MAVQLKEQLLTILKLFKEPRVLKFLLSQKYSGYLMEQGWFNAFTSNMSIGADKEPLPWMTYPFIDFIKERLNKKLTLFEFGSGNSTLFFAERVKKVIAIEHDKQWFNSIKTKMPENVIIHLSSNKEEYQTSILNSEKVDIIIVDGENRNECIYNSVKGLSSIGVIILDDSERKDYKEGKSFLKNSDFKHIDFWGISPGTFFKRATTIFYKEQNCMGI